MKNYPWASLARPVGITLLAGTLLCAMTSCTTAVFENTGAGFASTYQSGNLSAAVNAVQREAAKSNSNDGILWRLEQGSTLRTAALAAPGAVPAIQAPLLPQAEGESAMTVSSLSVSDAYLRSSLAAFDQAETKVNAYEEQAKIKVGAEFSATLTNLNALPYRGRAYDKVLMNTYKALIYLQLGEKDNARVELNRALQRQRDAVAQNQNRIAEAQSEAEQARQGQVAGQGGTVTYDPSRAESDPHTGPALNAVLAESTANMVSYGDYVNPFAVFLDALFFMVEGEGGSDLERGRKSMERVAAMVPDNPYIKADLAQATAAAQGHAPEEITYVIFETGIGPDRDQTRIDIPTFLVSNRLAYVGAAFPKLRFHSSFVPSLAITAAGEKHVTATLASIDSVVANDFKNEWPSVVTKTLISTATKAIVQSNAQKQADQAGELAGLVGKLALTALNVATTRADTRAWSSLPKEFQYARIRTPADRQLTLAAGNDTLSVTLSPGAVNVVLVKSISPASPLLVSQFALK